MISTTSEVLAPTGSHWPTTDSSETAAMTAVTASSTGMPAATSAPNTTSSRISVTGMEVASALRKSLPTALLTAAEMLASPVSATTRSGCSACTAATACCAGWTADVASSGLPGTVKVTSALRPSADTSAVLPDPSGERMSAADLGSALSAAATCRAAWRICGSDAKVAPADCAWISTLSAGGLAAFPVRLCSVRSAWPD